MIRNQVRIFPGSTMAFLPPFYIYLFFHLQTTSSIMVRLQFETLYQELKTAKRSAIIQLIWNNFSLIYILVVLFAVTESNHVYSLKIKKSFDLYQFNFVFVNYLIEFRICNLLILFGKENLTTESQKGKLHQISSNRTQMQKYV